MSKIKVGKKSYEEKEVIKKDTALTSGIWRILG